MPLTLEKFWQIKAVGLGFSIGALISFFYAGKFSLQAHHFVKNGLTAQAEIVNIGEKKIQNRTFYDLELQFTDQQGQPHHIQSSIGAASRDKIGDRLEIIYQRDDQNNVALNKFSFIWVKPLAAVANGILDSIIGLAAFLLRRYLQRRETRPPRL